MPRKQQKSYETADKIFPTRLREAMSAAEMNQTQLANAIGVQRQTISNYTLGQSSPDCEMLAKIASALNVSTDYLVGLAEESSPNLDLAKFCEYTGLSDSSVVLLSIFRKLSILEPLNMVFNSMGSDFLSKLNDVYCECQVTKAALENSADEIREMTEVEDYLRDIISGSVSNPEILERKNSLELSLYKFSRVCDRIPDLFGASDLLDEIGKKNKASLRLDNGGKNESTES